MGVFQASDLTQLKIELHQKAAARGGGVGGKRKAEEDELEGEGREKRRSDPSAGYGVKPAGKKASKDVWGGEGGGGGGKKETEGSTRFLFE